ncbi:hypothetical protein GCM10023184_37650 [Flaviaesturariibacter amylovorans]|uniref:Uncharacterized protein n=1 Tax=Flaviaesturariibacter amylovorans TaxID=1084520 RepID=A0ABP8HJ56_9BACT
MIWINLQIAARYEAATGKTRALFGIVELTYGYKYFLAFAGLLATALGIVAYRRGEQRLGTFATVIALVALLMVFLRIWTLMVDRSA